MTLETIFNHNSDRDSTDGLRQCVRPFKSAYQMDENLVYIQPRPKTSDSDTVSEHILTRIKIFTTVTIPSGLKTSLTRSKVPQGNNPGLNHPNKPFLTMVKPYGKALTWLLFLLTLHFSHKLRLFLSILWSVVSVISL